MRQLDRFITGALYANLYFSLSVHTRSDYLMNTFVEMCYFVYIQNENTNQLSTIHDMMYSGRTYFY